MKKWVVSKKLDKIVEEAIENTEWLGNTVIDVFGRHVDRRNGTCIMCYRNDVYDGEVVDCFISVK